MTQRHNEIRDLIHDLTTLVWNQTIKEPIVRETSRDPHQDALIGDISTRGVWQLQSTAIFDIRVIDSDAPSYLSKTRKRKDKIQHCLRGQACKLYTSVHNN